MIFTRLLILGLFALASIPLLAQRANPPVCATPDLTLPQRRALSSQAAFALRTKQASGVALTGVTYVPIRPHIIRRSNGTGGMTLARLNNVMALANSYYVLNGSGIQFYFCGTTPDYVDNDALFNQFPAFDESGISGRDAVNALNQYYINAFDINGLGGYAYFPDEDGLETTRSFILNESDETDLGNRLLPHELGHNFSLLHTFGNSNDGTAELVTRGQGANCKTEGDELCDTPADPYGMPGATVTSINGCQTYSGTATDAQGNRYAPSVTNIMSYYFPCAHDFTPGQYDRMQAGLALRQSHKNYSLDCPPTAVTAPDNLAASIVNGSVVLTWRDRGTNEMGYFIERSLSATGGFIPIGGVAPDATTFTDTKAASFTTYYYRLKPSNATTAGLSTTISIKTPPCHPSYGGNTCAEGDGLAGFVLNNVALSQNSGCSVDGYSSTTTSAVVSAGRSYTFAGTLLTSAYQEGVSVWADLNGNGLFEASQNEQLYQTPGTITTGFSGTVTFPASLTIGPLTLRVIVAYNMVPTDPCGIYTYGETEDYVLNVVTPPTADLRLSMRVNDRTPTINQPVSYSLTLYNDGPANATGIRWQNRLPAGLIFIGGDAGVAGSATAVTGTSDLSLATGQSVTYAYQLRPNQPGSFVNAAQIVNSNQPDPDSQPGSGTADGQDDATWVDIRTPSDGGLRYNSPNPNQAPLPSVAPNQPLPDPAKADLSLTMAVSNRTPALNRTVSFSITVSNAGGKIAPNVVVRDTLRGLRLQSSPSGITVVNTTASYSIIEGTIASLSVGQSAQLVFTAVITASGSLRNVAQIWSAGIADPDSTPGMTTPAANNLNGEDDTAWVDLRATP